MLSLLQNGLTAYDLATILYNNERVVVTEKGIETREPIIKENMAKYFPSVLSSEQHFRSSSFSYHRGSYQIGMDGSTVSLPVSAVSNSLSLICSLRYMYTLGCY